MSKKGQIVVRYAYIRWSKTLISGSGQQAKAQDSRHSYHSRQRVARYACLLQVPWHSYHQKYAQKGQIVVRYAHIWWSFPVPFSILTTKS